MHARVSIPIYTNHVGPDGATEEGRVLGHNCQTGSQVPESELQDLDPVDPQGAGWLPRCTGLLGLHEAVEGREQGALAGACVLWY